MRFLLAKRLNPISQPVVFNLPDFTIAEILTETVSFSLVECPVQDSVATIEKPRAIEFDNFLVTTGVEDISNVIDGVLLTPEIETLFEPLTRPKVAGKRYREPDKILDDGNKRQTAFNLGIALKCRHDLPQDLCQTCRDQRATKRRLKREKESAAVDVFEQLRYILQPPILKAVGQPTVFPNGLRPYDFQIAGVKWLVDRTEALLADEMGLGKTIQAIIAMRVLFRNGSLQRALVVCPASMTIVWERELKSWAPDLRPLRIHGSADVRSEAWKAPAEVYIISYETLWRDVPDISSDQFDLCILDEAQKIKNPNTNAQKGVKKLNPKWRWALSGTPIENTSQDAVSIFSFLVPNLFSATELPDAATVRSKIMPYTLRRSIEDSGLDIPDLIHQEHWLELSDSQRARYNHEEESGIAGIQELGEDATRINVLALISKLKQICNYDEESGESCKLEFLKDGLEEIVAKNDKALIFSQYPVKTLKLIEPKLKEFKPLTFDGSLNLKKRDDVIQEFQNDEDNQILLISTKAGGTGITLTRANHVFHFDHWWNPAVVDQGTARVRRIGQEKPVFAHSLYASNTVEERIAQILKEKRDTFKEVFGDLASEIDEIAIARLSDEVLFSLFGLKPPEKEKTTKFLDMTPEEFERSVCTLFEAWGYKLSVTGRPGDGGIDLDGYSQGMGGGRVVVQCKRYSNTVPVDAVRDLFGVVAADHNISRGFLVTTSKFSKPTRDFVKDKRITLIDGSELEARFADIKASS